MSFFIKPNQNKYAKRNPKSFGKQNDNNRGRKRKNEDDDVGDNEEITSDEDEPDDAPGHRISDSEDENETPHDKRLRMAKVYLKEIEKAEERYQEKQELDNIAKGTIIEKRLKDDYLKQIGRYREEVSDKYSHDVDRTKFKLLKCKEHKEGITCLCVSFDNKFIFSGSKNGGLVKWSLIDKKMVTSRPYVKKGTSDSVIGHSSAILCMAISSDDEYLAVGDVSSNIQIWNPASFKHFHTFAGHKESVYGLAFQRDTHMLYSASKDKSVRVWSLDERMYVETVFGHTDGVTSIDALYRERAITSGGRDRTVRIWKIAEESQLIYNGHSGSIDCVRLVNEDTFISGGDDGDLCLWSVNKKKAIHTIPACHGVDPLNKQPNWVTALAAYVNTDLIASGSYDGLIKLWRLENRKKLTFLFSIPIVGFISSLAFTHDGKHLIAGVSNQHRLGRWQVIKGAHIGVLIIPLNRKQ